MAAVAWTLENIAAYGGDPKKVCVALGHDRAWFVSCPFADHGRVYTAGIPYVEMFVQGRIPAALRVK